jgi:hypothetical protein
MIESVMIVCMTFTLLVFPDSTVLQEPFSKAADMKRRIFFFVLVGCMNF